MVGHVIFLQAVAQWSRRETGGVSGTGLGVGGGYAILRFLGTSSRICADHRL